MHRPTWLGEPGDPEHPPTRTVNPSYRELRRGQPAERASHDGRNLWLRLTAPAPIPVSASPVQRERQVELTAYAALGTLAAGLALLPLSLSGHAALVSAGLLMAGAPRSAGADPPHPTPAPAAGAASRTRSAAGGGRRWGEKGTNWSGGSRPCWRRWCRSRTATSPRGPTAARRISCGRSPCR